MVNTFPRGEWRTDEVDNVSWLWDHSKARLGLEIVSRTTEEMEEEETDESRSSENYHTHTHTHTIVKQ